MDEQAIRSSARAVGDALVAGDVEAILALLSDELQRNPGEIVQLLPLPATDVDVVSVDRPAASWVVVLRVAGETADTELQTRWKERDGQPRIVEVSHLSRTDREPQAVTGGGADDETLAGDDAGE